MQWSYSSLVVAGARVHWAELGSATHSRSTPILLLHGLHDSHLTWKAIAPQLAAGRRVLMPDLVGCGLSDRPDASYTLSWHAEVIAEWLLALGITVVDVVGHSFGGGVAQILLLQRKLRVRRLALLASGGLGREVGFWLRLAATCGVVERFGQPFMAYGTRLALRTMGCARVPADHVVHLSAMNSRPGSARAFERTVRDVIGWRGQTRMFYQRAHELTSLPAVAVYWGDRDSIIPVAHALAFVNTLSGARLHRLPTAGHFLHHDQPELVAELLGSFLCDATVTRASLRPAARPAPLLSRAASWLRTLVASPSELGSAAG
jgi:pimeloyl-ACP methyl ester carboxylesterase